MSKLLPVIGGAVGGVFDAAVTRGIGAAAKTIFAPVEPIELAEGDPSSK
jgi:hypothetical protein